MGGTIWWELLSLIPHFLEPTGSLSGGWEAALSTCPKKLTPFLGHLISSKFQNSHQSGMFWQSLQAADTETTVIKTASSPEVIESQGTEYRVWGKRVDSLLADGQWWRPVTLPRTCSLSHTPLAPFACAFSLTKTGVVRHRWPLRKFLLPVLCPDSFSVFLVLKEQDASKP